VFYFFTDLRLIVVSVNAVLQFFQLFDLEIHHSRSL